MAAWQVPDPDLTPLTEGPQSMGARTARVHIMGHPPEPIPLEEALIRQGPILRTILLVIRQPGPFLRKTMTLAGKCLQHTDVPRLPAVHISPRTLLTRLVVHFH